MLVKPKLLCLGCFLWGPSGEQWVLRQASAAKWRLGSILEALWDKHPWILKYYKLSEDSQCRHHVHWIVSQYENYRHWLPRTIWMIVLWSFPWLPVAASVESHPIDSWIIIGTHATNYAARVCVKKKFPVYLYIKFIKWDSRLKSSKIHSWPSSSLYIEPPLIWAPRGQEMLPPESGWRSPWHGEDSKVIRMPLGNAWIVWE